MIGSLNGERAKSEFLLLCDSQQAMSPARSSLLECSSNNHSHRRVQPTHFQGWLGSNLDNSHVTGNVIVERPQFSLHKSLDYFIRLAAKFPLVLILLVIAFLLVPGSLTVLVLCLLVTILLALPFILVLVFAYPTLGWFLREITSWGWFVLFVVQLNVWYCLKYDILVLCSCVGSSGIEMDTDVKSCIYLAVDSWILMH